jgi:hypothetical protein
VHIIYVPQNESDWQGIFFWILLDLNVPDIILTICRQDGWILINKKLEVLVLLVEDALRASPPVHLKNLNEPFKSGDVTKFNKIDTTG